MFWEYFTDLCSSIGKKPNTVCKELGFSTATATHWKNGTMPNAEAIIKIAEYFNCSTDLLLGMQERKIAAPDTIRSSIVKMINSCSDSQLDRLLAFLEGMLSE